MDRSIVEAARAGERPAFDALVRKEVGRVYRLSLAITGNEADASDAAQETFVTAWQRICDLRDPASFDAWLTRIAVNTGRMTLRARRRRMVREIPMAAGDADGLRAPGDGQAAEDAMALRAALARLPDEQRALLALRHVDGRGIPEIAMVLGIPDGTAKSRLFTARRALERALAEEAADA